MGPEAIDGLRVVAGCRRVWVGFVELTPVNDNDGGDLLWLEATSSTLRPRETT
jgi:hypothetical protein